MKTNMLKLFLFICFILFTNKSYGVKELYLCSNKIGAAEIITPPQVYTVTDGKYTDMESYTPSTVPDNKTFSGSGGYYNSKIINRLILRINKDNQKLQLYPYAITVYVSIKTYTFDHNSSPTGFVSQTMERALTVFYDPSKIGTNETILEFNDQSTNPMIPAGNKMEITITPSANVNPASAINYMNIELIPQIEIERFYNFVPALQIDGITSTPTSAPSVTASYTSQSSVLHLEWVPPSGYQPEGYDLEWTYINDFNNDNSNNIIHNTSAHIIFNDERFNQNNTRISTTNSSYEIPIVYDRGYLVYRVRALGRVSYDNYNTNLPGIWSGACTTCTVLNDYSNTSNKVYYQISSNAHSPELNWQYSIAFAEEGKNKVSANYFDGSLRGHQTIVKSNTLNSTIVSEKVYDYQGRPVISILPFPTNDRELKYYPNLNINYNTSTTVTSPYTKEYFDKDAAACNTATNPLYTSAGASKYYSVNRNKTGNNSIDEIEKYIPDAGGYPLTQTIYTPDNTGRIQTQTGLGPEFNLSSTGSPKLTKYLYDKPFQEELYRLFGQEAGDASHYKKNTVIDPNGQISVSYLDPAGKVIATTLTGVTPVNVSRMSSNPYYTGNTPEAYTFDILNRKNASDQGSENKLDLINKTLSLNTAFTVPKDGAQRKFGYDLTNTAYTISCSSEPVQTQCFNCVLDLKINLKNECDEEQFTDFPLTSSNQVTIGTTDLTALGNGTYDPSSRCSAETGPTNYSTNMGTGLDPQYTVNLNTGTYYLYKTLSVNEQALDKYTDLYLSDTISSCLKTRYNFLLEQDNFLDGFGCDMSCTECISKLGSYSRYENPAPLSGIPKLTQAEYDRLVAICNSACDIKSPKCISAFQAMLADISPQGQYGQIRKEAEVKNGSVTIPETNEIQADLEITAGGVDRTQYDPRLFPLSVFNEGNLLPLKSSFYVDKSTHPNWRHPFYNGDLDDPTYRNEFEKEDFVTITLKEGKYTPAVLQSHINDLIPLTNGQFKCRPQYLDDVRDFLAVWKQSWAKSLVIYHPEYKLYDMCNELQVSHDYDEAISEIEDYLTAKNRGYFNPLGIYPAGTGWQSNDVVDPYFKDNALKPPFATHDDYTYFENLMQNFITNKAGTPVTISIWDFAYRTVICPNTEITCNNTIALSTVTDYKDPFPTLTTAQQDEAWQIFKGLYLSLKQRFMDDKNARLAIANAGEQYTSYNGCIGNKSFNPAKYDLFRKTLLSFNFWDLIHLTFQVPDVNSQYFNFEQPCNCNRYMYYTEKTPRFPQTEEIVKLRNSDKKILYNTDEENYYVLPTPDQAQSILDEAAAITSNGIFQQCGKCPLAIKLESFLNSLAKEGNLTNGSLTNIECNTKEITAELFGKFGAVMNDNLTWSGSQNGNPSASVPYELTVSLSKQGPVNLCDLKLIFPSNSIISSTVYYDFDDIKSLGSITYVPTSVTGFNYNFTSAHEANNQFFITAKVQIKSGDPDYDATQPTKTKTFVLKGASTCLDIGSCTLANNCTASSVAIDFLKLFNTLLFTGTKASSATTYYSSLFKSSTDITLTDESDERLIGGMPSNLKYAFDKAIQPNYKNLYEAWKWKANSISANNMTIRISGSSTGNTGYCDLDLILDASSGLSFLNDDFVKFTHIAPDPNNLVNGFILTALMTDNVNTPPFKYVLIKGSSSCFSFGNCSAELPDPYQMGKTSKTDLKCGDFPNKDSLLLMLNSNEGGVLGEGELYNYVHVGCQIYDQTSLDAGYHGLLIDTRIPSATLSVQNFEAQLNSIIPTNMNCIDNSCPVIPLKKIRLYNAQYYQRNNNNGTVNLNPEGGDEVVAGMFWACVTGVQTFHYDRNGNYLFHSETGYIDLPWSPCYIGTGPFGEFFNVDNDHDDCEIYYAYSHDCISEKIVLCGAGGPWTNAGWHPNGQSLPEGMTCPFQLEFPNNGYGWATMKKIIDIYPDPERQEAGYCLMLVQMTDGNYLEVKGYNPCLPKVICKACTGNEILPKGTFDFDAAITTQCKDNSYNYVNTMTSPYIDNGQYRITDNIPSPVSGADPKDGITDNSADGSTNFFVCKSHMPISNDWTKISTDPNIDNLPVIWGESYRVEQQTDYEVSFYYLNVNQTASTTGNNQLLLRINYKDVLLKEVKYDVNYQWVKATYLWNSGSENQLVLALHNVEADDDNYVAIDDIAITKICGCTGDPQTVNSTFDQGNIGVNASTDILYSAGGGSSGQLGHYDINNSFTWTNSGGTTVIDHTAPGNGNMCFYRLKHNTNNSSNGTYKLWSQKIYTVRNTDYSFTGWWQMYLGNNASNGIIKAIINLKLNGDVVQSIESGNNGAKWNVIMAKWNSGDHTYANLEIEVLIDRLTYTGEFEIVLDDIIFKEECTSSFCDLPESPAISFNPKTNCENYMLAIKTHNAGELYKDYINEKKREFREAYISKCLSVNENFLMKTEIAEYHTTLYYYDQSGNLIRTIPPEGVKPLTATEVTNLKNDIAIGEQNTYTQHSYTTTYKYNSLNQLVQQSTADQQDYDIWDGKDANPYSNMSTEDIKSIAYCDKFKGIIVGGLTTNNDGFIKIGDPTSNTWSTNTSAIDYGNLKNVHVYSATQIYAVNEWGNILYSSDGGTNWYAKNSPINKPLFYIRKLSSLLIVFTEDGRFWKSTDDGDTWGTEQKIFNNISLKSISFSGNFGVALASDNSRFYCSDISSSSASWQKQVNFKVSNLAKTGRMKNQDIFYAAGKNGTILLSYDKGNSWKKITTNIQEHIKDIYLWDMNKGILLTTTNKIYQIQVDYDISNWEQVTTIFTSQTINDFAVNGTYAYVMDNNGKVYIHDCSITTSWITSNTATITQPSGSGYTYNNISVPDNSNVFIAGASTTTLSLYKSVLSGTSWSSFAGVNLGSLTSGTFIDINANTATSLEVIVNNGTSNSMYEIKDINTGANTSVVTSISLVSNPKSFEVNSLNNPYILGVSSTNTSVIYEKSAAGIWGQSSNPLPLTSTNAISVWMESNNNNSKGICIGSDGSIFTTNYKWMPNTPNATTIFDRTTKITIPDLNDVHTDGSNIVAVGVGGTIVYTTISSSIPASDWIISQDVKDNNNLLDVSGKDVNLFAVGENAQLFHLKYTSGVYSVTKITGFSPSVIPSTASLNLVEVENVTTSNPVASLIITSLDKVIYTVNVNLSPVSYSSSSAICSSCSTGVFRSISNSGTLTVLVGDKTYLATSPYSMYKVSYNTGSGASTGSPVILDNVRSLNKVIVLKGTQQAIAVGNDGNIIKSYNKGLSWQFKNSGVSTDLLSVSFSDDFNGIAVGKGKTVCYTNDGGETWHSYTIGTSNIDFIDVGLAKPTRCIIVGKNPAGAGTLSSIFVNTDNINSSGSWNLQGGTIPNVIYNAISFPGTNAAYVVGNNSTLVRLTYNSSTQNYDGTELLDGSATAWSTAIHGSSVDLTSVYFRDDENGFIGGDAGFMMRTRNAGSDRTFKFSESYAGKKIIAISGFSNENLHLIMYGSSKSDTVRYLKNGEYSSRFFYDGLGRLVASQNTKQMLESKNTYSYTFFDYKGRIVEVGKKTTYVNIENVSATISSITKPIYENGIINYPYFEAWIKSDNDNYPRKEVTRTFYDAPYYSYPSCTLTVNGSSFIQDNLRNRVTSSTYTDQITADDIDGSACNDTYKSASHYSYDVHGNVKSIVHENKVLSVTQAQIKRIDYEYDLLSGNVHQVSYQSGQTDQFYHQYQYDADNRITDALTSHDGKIWQQDAHYLYYRHGPLARVELGTQQVQGIDYAYTIQGWLKGVNSNTLYDYRDIGKDAYQNTTNPNAHFARDEYGFSLNYFSGDYSPTDVHASTVKNFLSDASSSGMKSATKDLYNGNISNMVTTIRQFMSGSEPVAQAMVYGYDQLNRLKSTSQFTNLTASSNTWQSNGTSAVYNETYSYDANGNITFLTRKDDAGTTLDDFTYNYENTANTYAKNTNKLRSVSDAVTASSYDGDIENGQASENYSYDAIGNLIKDEQEEIEEITWTVYGKIKTITRTTSSTKPDLEFYYDPSGNRILKIVKPAGSSSADWVYTQYVRDAQGNILSTYNLKGEDYKQLNTNLYGSSRIGEFIPDAYEQCGAKFDISSLNTPTLLGSWAYDFLSYQLGLNNDYANDWQTYFQTNFETDISNTVASISSTSPDYYSKFLKEWAAMMCRLRWFNGLNDNAFISIVKDDFAINWLNNITSASSNWSSFDESMWATVVAERKSTADLIYNNLLSGNYIPYDDGIYHYEAGSRRYELNNHLGNVLAVITDKKEPKCAGGTCNDLPVLTNHFTQGVEGWSSYNTATLVQDNNDKLSVSALGSNGGAMVSFAVEPSQTYSLQLNLVFAETSSRISVVVIDQGSTTLLNTTATSNSGLNTFSFSTGSGSSTCTFKIFNNTNTTGFTIDEVSITASGVEGVEYYTAQVVSAQDYYPFGMLMPNRIYQDPWYSDSYRFLFNGMEKDDEVKGGGNSLDFGARIYDSRLGRWMSRDPHEKKYPGFSPYLFSNGNPIFFKDINGKDGIATTTMATGVGAGTLDNPNSIEISAIFYYQSGMDADIPAGLNAAVAAWNGSAYTIKRGDQYYKVTFKLEAKVGDINDAGSHAISDGNGSQYTNGNFLKEDNTKTDEGDVATNAGMNMTINADKVAEYAEKGINKLDLFTEIFKHEIGHSLGLLHDTKGLMQETLKILPKSMFGVTHNTENSVSVSVKPITMAIVAQIIKNLQNPSSVRPEGSSGKTTEVPATPSTPVVTPEAAPVAPASIPSVPVQPK